MRKSRPDGSDILIKNNRKSTLTNHKLEKCCESDVFTDESSEFSNESSEFQNNATALTSQFKIISSGTDENCLFHALNNIVFGGKLIAKSIRDENVLSYLRKMKYINILEKEI